MIYAIEALFSLQDSEAMKMRLEMMKQKKSTLMAEVRYNIRVYIPHLSSLSHVAWILNVKKRWKVIDLVNLYLIEFADF